MDETLIHRTVATISKDWNKQGFNPVPGVPGSTLFAGSLEVRPSGVGTSLFN